MDEKEMFVAEKSSENSQLPQEGIMSSRCHPVQCPLESCRKTITSLPRHLKLVHKWDEVDARAALSRFGLRRPRYPAGVTPKQRRKGLICPLATCKRKLVKLSSHMRNHHKIHNTETVRFCVTAARKGIVINKVEEILMDTEIISTKELNAVEEDEASNLDKCIQADIPDERIHRSRKYHAFCIHRLVQSIKAMRDTHILAKIEEALCYAKERQRLNANTVQKNLRTLEDALKQTTTIQMKDNKWKETKAPCTSPATSGESKGDGVPLHEQGDSGTEPSPDPGSQSYTLLNVSKSLRRSAAMHIKNSDTLNQILMELKGLRADIATGNVKYRTSGQAGDKTQENALESRKSIEASSSNHLRQCDHVLSSGELCNYLNKRNNKEQYVGKRRGLRSASFISENSHSLFTGSEIGEPGREVEETILHNCMGEQLVIATNCNCEVGNKSKDNNTGFKNTRDEKLIDNKKRKSINSPMCSFFYMLKSHDHE